MWLSFTAFAFGIFAVAVVSVVAVVAVAGCQVERGESFSLKLLSRV